MFVLRILTSNETIGKKLNFSSPFRRSFAVEKTDRNSASTRSSEKEKIGETNSVSQNMSR
ncbi:hypothetical protein GWI33_001191, partial [Rhynchophorus ferrugineus]